MTELERERHFWQGLIREIAHQMGTPLSALYGWLELLPNAKDLRSVAEEMTLSINRLTEISSRLGQIGIPAKKEEISLEILIEEVVNNFQKSLPDGINIRMEIKGKTIVSANGTLLSWAIEHLIKNSVDAMVGGRGEISLRIYPQGKNTQIEISDNGRGIAAINRDDLFRPGFSTKSCGRGVGLSLAKTIIEDIHKGKITIEKHQTGRGTTVRIRLNHN